MILDAFEQLWSAGRDIELVFLGSRGWANSRTISRISALQRQGRLTWIEHISDGAASATIASSSAAIFVPETEGYGLPAVEALALGCPVVASADLPSLHGLPKAGQLRLDPVTVQSLKVAVEQVSAHTTNHRLRCALRELQLPTWKECVSRLETWIGDTLVARTAH